MSIEFLNLDTYYSSKLSPLNAYSTIFTLTVPKRNIKRIYLKSLEMPLSFGNVRPSGGFNILTITFNDGSSQNIVLIENAYSDISLLMSDLSSATITNATFTFSTSGNFTSVVMVSSTYTSFSFANTGLLQILGITPDRKSVV